VGRVARAHFSSQGEGRWRLERLNRLESVERPDEGENREEEKGKDTRIKEHLNPHSGQSNRQFNRYTPISGRATYERNPVSLGNSVGKDSDKAIFKDDETAVHEDSDSLSEKEQVTTSKACRDTPKEDPELRTEYGGPELYDQDAMSSHGVSQITVDEQKDESANMESDGGFEGTPPSPKIHILGTSSVGKFVAHSLAGLSPAPPVALLLHQPLLKQQWHDEGEEIEVIREGVSEIRRGFTVESAAYAQRGTQRHKGPNQWLRDTDTSSWAKIDNLIVTTSNSTTVPALRSIQHRLHSDSTVCFLESGMGIIEEVNAHVFTDPRSRPAYILAFTSHGVAPESRYFSALHHSIGKTCFAVVPSVFSSKVLAEPGTPSHIEQAFKQTEEFHEATYKSLVRRTGAWRPSTRYLARTLTRPSALHAVGYTYNEFSCLQLDQLAINCVIQPLTVLFDCLNGDILYNYSATQAMRAILTEVSQVVSALPVTQSVPGVQDRFSVTTLEKRVEMVLRRAKGNASSMLQDVRKGRKTQIDYLNGYITICARELGIPCPTNTMMVHMVKAKQQMANRKNKSFIPFDDSARRKWG
jgi:2-dehydropantoate 2-reductase